MRHGFRRSAIGRLRAPMRSADTSPGRRCNWWRLLEHRTVVAVMIETPEAVAACDSIAAVEGIDMILVGPSDLSAEMGIHGQYENPDFQSAVDSVAAACRSRRVALGMAGIKSVELLSRFVELGLRFISAGTDIGMMTEAATTRAQALRGLTDVPREPT